jgi:hypothetical protein
MEELIITEPPPLIIGTVADAAVGAAVVSETEPTGA